MHESIYQPRHRIAVYPLRGGLDHQSNARCVIDRGLCDHGYCPRHSPFHYADAMARHAAADADGRGGSFGFTAREELLDTHEADRQARVAHRAEWNLAGAI